jgi:acyl carrier protein
MDLRQEILEKIIEKSADLFHKTPAEFNAATRFSDLGGKSVDLVKLISVLEDKYEVEISFMEFRRKKTFGEAAHFVAGLLGG